MKMLVEGESALKVGCGNLADFHAALRSVLLYAVLDMGAYVHVPSCAQCGEKRIVDTQADRSSVKARGIDAGTPANGLKLS
ncbi:MAG: hypothetical protein LCH71_16505 [Proteobacteria bacterium]|jgi:hypothetical protein|nr:hypothetical protein [Pseudomonadota bacterium]